MVNLSSCLGFAEDHLPDGIRIAKCHGVSDFNPKKMKSAELPVVDEETLRCSYHKSKYLILMQQLIEPPVCFVTFSWPFHEYQKRFKDVVTVGRDELLGLFRSLTCGIPPESCSTVDQSPNKLLPLENVHQHAIGLCATTSCWYATRRDLNNPQLITSCRQ